MKLRNRQTGKVYTLSDDLYIEYTQGGKIELRAIIPGGNMSYYYDSLDKLYYEWEDVRGALIKDEKVRKAVRAWAEANNYPKTMELYYNAPNFVLRSDISTIEFDKEIEPLRHGDQYTIEELCGEEDK